MSERLIGELLIALQIAAIIAWTSKDVFKGKGFIPSVVVFLILTAIMFAMVFVSVTGILMIWGID